MTTKLETGFTRMIGPPGLSAIGLPQPDGTTFQVIPDDDLTVAVPDAIVADLARNGFHVVEWPLLSDDEWDDLQARQSDLTARLLDLEAEQAAVSADGTAASERLEMVKASLEAGEGSLDDVREAERAVAESGSRATLIGEAVANITARLDVVTGRIDAEVAVRGFNEQRALAQPLIQDAAEAAEAFAAAVVMARDALADRAAILDKIRTDYPRVTLPVLSLRDLGAALQAAMAETQAEQTDLVAFTRLAEILIVGPVHWSQKPFLQSADAQARLAKAQVVR